MEQKLSRLAFCRYQAAPCDDIAFKLFTNLQTFHATTRFNFAFLTFSRCSLLYAACAWQLLLRQSLTKTTHLPLFGNFLLPFCVVLICLFNRCFFIVVADFIHSHLLPEFVTSLFFLAH